MKTSRRDFLKFIVAGSTLAAISSIASAPVKSAMTIRGVREIATVKLPVSKKCSVIILSARQLRDQTWVADVVALR